MSDRSTWPLKQLAWAFGCAKKGSDREQLLRDALVRRIIKAMDRTTRPPIAEDALVALIVREVDG